MRIAILSLLCLAACTKQDATKIESAGVEAGRAAAICVLEHPDLFNDPTILAKTCGIAAVEDVMKLLDAHHAAMRAELRSKP